MELNELASQASKYYVRRKRDNVEEFYSHGDDAPQWVKDMTRIAHNDGNIFPNDFIFEFVVDALDIISECDDEDEIEDRINEIESDVYNSELLAWISSNLYFAEYVNDAVNELGLPDKFDLYQELGYGQIRQRQEVARSILNSLKEQVKQEAR